MHPDLQNALLGAGLGGLGGLGMGLISKRKKNPLTSALTGAALGGTLGYALPAVYRGMNTPPTTGNAAQDAQIAAKWHTLSGPEQLMHFAKGTLPTLDAGPAPPGEPGTLAQQAKDQTGVGGAINKTIAQGAGGVGGYMQNHPGLFAANLGLGGLQAGYAWKTAPGQLYRDVRLGTLSQPGGPGVPPGQPQQVPGGMQGQAQPVPPNPEVARMKRLIGDASGEVARLGPLGERMGPFQNARWSRLNPFRTWNEGVMGSALSRIQSGGTLPAGSHMGRLFGDIPAQPGVQAGHGPVTSGMVSAMEHAGLTSAHRPVRGFGGKMRTGAKYIIPQLAIHAAPAAWNWASNMLSGGGQPE
jgi:hypothetical protein